MAWSSGEAEHYGMVKGASIGFGLQAALGDFGIKTDIDLKNDASAATGVAARTGLGKARHLEVCQLWLQEKVRKSIVQVFKVSTDENVADSMTKHVSRDLE